MVRRRQGLTWFGQSVETCSGKLAELRSRLPSFGRKPFEHEGNQNEFLQAIVRLPMGEGDRSIPVATVSSQYDLIQHREVFDWLVDGLKANGEKPEELGGTLTLSTYGERMKLTISLAKYDFDPGDKYPLKLLAFALNSVDKSTALEIHLGWWRQVCSNGMKVQVKGSTARRIHLLGRKTASEVGGMLRDQLADIETERYRYRRWLGTPVDPDRFRQWADADVARTWGPHAAARSDFDDQHINQARGPWQGSCHTRTMVQRGWGGGSPGGILDRRGHPLLPKGCTLEPGYGRDMVERYES